MVSKYSGGGGWVEGLHLDTADTWSVNGGDLDVSLVSPVLGPGVSDEVVVLATLGSVSNGGDGVVEVGSAVWGVQNTTRVSLEDELVGLNGNGGWSLGDGGLELVDRVGWDVSVGLHVNLTLVLGVLARSVSGGVDVIRLEVLGILLSVVEGGMLPSSIATIGDGVAVNELLLGEVEELSGGDEVSSLDGAGGGEGPA